MSLFELLAAAVVQVLHPEHPPQPVAHALGDGLLEIAAFRTIGGHGSWSTSPAVSESNGSEVSDPATPADCSARYWHGFKSVLPLPLDRCIA